MVSLTRLFCVLLCSIALTFAQARSPRLSDKDLDRLMKNAHEDTKTFSNSFKKAVEKSSIRKTSKEKEAKQLADRLVSQTEGMTRRFDDKRTADSTLPVVYRSLGEMEATMRDLSLTGQVQNDFTKVKGELGKVSDQFSYTPPN